MNVDIQKPPRLSEDETFYIIYSPEKFKIKPFNGVTLNLKTKLDLLPCIEAGLGFYQHS